jgi:hypothetical protein
MAAKVQRMRKKGRKEGRKEIVTNIAQRSGPWQKETGG